MKNLILYITILFSSIVSAQSFNFSCELLVAPVITLSQDLTDDGWYISFANGEAGEIFNDTYAGYKIINESAGEELTVDTYAEAWIITYNFDLIAAEDFEGTLQDAINVVVAHYSTNQVGQSGSDHETDQTGDLREDAIFEHSLEFATIVSTWANIPQYVTDFGASDGEAWLRATHTNGKYVRVTFQYNIHDETILDIDRNGDGDALDTDVVTDIDISTLAHHDNSTGADVEASWNEPISIVQYLQSVRRLLPIDDEFFIVTQIPDQLFFRVQAYEYFGAIEGNSIPGTGTIIRLDSRINSETLEDEFFIITSDVIDNHENWVITLSDSGIFAYNDINGEDLGPYATIAETLQYILNLN